MSSRFLKIHPSDNVFVALTDLKIGEQLNINGHTLSLVDNIPAKHKFLDKPLNVDEEVIMYGGIVGKVFKPIAAGAAIGTHNVKHKATPFSGRTKSYSWTPPDVSKFRDKTFLGYHRPDGQVGTANYWLIVPLVFCENRNVDAIREAFMDELGFSKPDAYKDYVHQLVQLYQNNKPISSASFQPATTNGHSRIFKNIDGIKFLTHQGGCGGTRQDSQTLCKLIGGYIHNPNVAGATVLSLGCQNAEIKTLQERLKEF